MPVYPGVSVRLTDAQLWTIVCADPAVSHRQLAETLSAHVNTITHAWRRRRRQGWTCRVSYLPCRHCGRLRTRAVRRRGQQVYHPARASDALKLSRKARYQRRWNDLPVKGVARYQRDPAAEGSGQPTPRAGSWIECA